MGIFDNKKSISRKDFDRILRKGSSRAPSQGGWTTSGRRVSSEKERVELGKDFFGDKKHKDFISEREYREEINQKRREAKTPEDRWNLRYFENIAKPSEPKEPERPAK